MICVVIGRVSTCIPVLYYCTTIAGQWIAVYTEYVKSTGACGTATASHDRQIDEIASGS